MTSITTPLGILLACASFAAASTNALSVRVSTADGSTLIGEPMVSDIQVRTSFADIALRLDQVASFRFTGTNGAVAVRLRNGDSLSGETGLREFPIVTLVGRVRVPVAMLQTLTTMASRTSLAPDLFDALVLHDSFDTDEGDRVADLSPKANHGKLMGKPATDPDGKVGRCLVLDGKDDYVDAGNAPVLRLQRDFTLMAWIWLDSTDASVGIITKSAGSPDQDRRGIEMHTGSSNLVGYFWDQATSFFSGSTVPGTLSKRRWHHVVLQHDSQLPNHQMRCYIDGLNRQPAFTCETISSVPTVRDVPEPVRIGCFGPSRYSMRGRLDEVMIFNRVLTEEDIKRIHDQQK